MLAKLPASSCARLLSHLEEVPLNLADTMVAANKMPRWAHFPTSGIVSLVGFMKDGDGVEVAMVGREGLAEAVELIGGIHAPTKGFVQAAGTALRLPMNTLRSLFLEDEALRSVVLQYVQLQSYMSRQLAACNRLHEVAPRMARWLLMVQDRLSADRFALTQEFLGEMLGARRTTVTLSARRLQDQSLIRYSRGKISILDRKGLEATACECYGVISRLEKTARQTTATRASRSDS